MGAAAGRSKQTGSGSVEAEVQGTQDTSQPGRHNSGKAMTVSVRLLKDFIHREKS